MIALATADLSAMPVDDVDQPFLEEAFAGRAEFVRWDDPAVDWSAYELVVLRSTWDYIDRPVEFEDWIVDVARRSRLLNPAGTVRWNVDKRYLGALGARGVPIGDTRYPADLDAVRADLGAMTADEVVVKPTVSAGSTLTGRFARTDPAAVELAGRILDAGKQVIVQRYYESVGRQGEIAVVHLGGRFSHALRKGPILDLGGGLLGGEYTEVVEPVTPSAGVRAAAEQVLAGYRDLAEVDPLLRGTDPLLYSRVDLIEGDQMSGGEPICLELELIEPSLFFETAPEAAQRFVDAVLERIRQRS